MSRLILALSISACLTLPAMSCPDEIDLSDVKPEQTASSFENNLKDMQNPGFVKSYCSLSPSEQDFAIQIYDSAYEGLDAERAQTLARMAIMIPDIEENLAYVAQNGIIREVDDSLESIAATRFTSMVRQQFPQTSTVLDDAYLAKLDALYEQAYTLIAGRELAANKQIDDAKDEIARLEKKISDLKEQISDSREDGRAQRMLLHELELYKP